MPRVKSERVRQYRELCATVREDPLAAAIVNAVNRTVRRYTDVEWDHVEEALGLVNQHVAFARIRARDENGASLPPREWRL